MNRDVTPGIGDGTAGRHPENTGQSDLAGLGIPTLSSAELTFAELVQAPMSTLLVVGDPDRLPADPGHCDPGPEELGLAPVLGLQLLDQGLAADLGSDETLPATMVSLCRALGLRCMVDGVETQTQLDAARGLGVDAVQGYLVGRPVAVDDVLDALAES